MKAGRKPKHQFNSLNVGEKAILKGKASVYPHQFISQYNKRKEGHEELRVLRQDGKVYAERVK